MNILESANFNEKDLVGLDRLHHLLEYTYQDEKAVEAIYNQKMWAISICRDLAAAQRMIDFEIDLAELCLRSIGFIVDLWTEKAILGPKDELRDIHRFERFIQRRLERIKDDIRIGRFLTKVKEEGWDKDEK
ncbi:hypothetical protein [Bacillus sp. OTU2372]|uniref:hypothetical protein n=1 Tax=Bacillus sp. OTU2372 TaxID=3043858 RepID=UPI00313CD423